PPWGCSRAPCGCRPLRGGRSAPPAPPPRAGTAASRPTASWLTSLLSTPRRAPRLLPGALKGVYGTTAPLGTGAGRVGGRAGRRAPDEKKFCRKEDRVIPREHLRTGSRIRPRSAGGRRKGVPMRWSVLFAVAGLSLAGAGTAPAQVMPPPGAYGTPYRSQPS